MEWKNFDIEEINTPSETVEKSLNGFENATKGLLKLTLFEKSELERLRKKYLPSFQFDLVLHSQFMTNYKFDVLELLYDVTLYPCAIILEKGIAHELDVKNSQLVVALENEEELQKTLEKVFSTKRFESIVAGLMKITTVAKDEEDNLPF